MSKFASTISFVCVGPQRTGSTWLYEILSAHADVMFPSKVKETYFFDQRYVKGMDWYLWHFQNPAEGLLCGEVGPTYFDSLPAPERIAEHFPDCKILINVRNPVEKTESTFKHFRNSGLVPDDFEKATRMQPRIIESGRYQVHSLKWEELFEKVHYVVQDDVIDNPQTVIDHVCQFLEIEPLELHQEASQKVNAATAPRSPKLVRLMERVSLALRGMRLYPIVELGKKIGLKRLYQGGKAVPGLSEQQKSMLKREFLSDIEWLERRLERDFSHWK